MPTKLLRTYTDQLPALAALAGQDIVCALMREGSELFLGCNAAASPADRHHGLTEIGMYVVENGMHAGALQIRDLPNGSMIYVSLRPGVG